MIYSEAIKQVSIELGLPPQVVKEAYESYWTFIRNNIKALPLKEDLSKEEFDKLRTNFNVPSLGKLSCTYDMRNIMGIALIVAVKYRRKALT